MYNDDNDLSLSVCDEISLIVIDNCEGVER